MDNLMENTGNDSTEQRIFDAAREVFVQKGLDGAKMQEIADRAGINKALLHYYYRTKEKLYETVAKAVLSRAVPLVRELVESEHPLEEKIERFIDLYVDLISRNPFIPLFLISEMNKHPQHFYDNILPKELPKPERFFQQVNDEIAAGRLRPIPPQHLLVNIVSLCIFPFLAKPMLQIILGMRGYEMQEFYRERKAVIKDFVFAAIRI